MPKLAGGVGVWEEGVVTCDDGAICWQHCSTDGEAAVGAVRPVAGPQTLGHELLHLICRETQQTTRSSQSPHLVHQAANQRPSDASAWEGGANNGNLVGLACHHDCVCDVSPPAVVPLLGCFGRQSVERRSSRAEWSRTAGGRSVKTTLCLRSHDWLPWRVRLPGSIRSGGCSLKFSREVGGQWWMVINLELLAPYRCYEVTILSNLTTRLHSDRFYSRLIKTF